MSEELTFAEAMALDPSEVETYHHGTGKWVSLRTAELQTVATMRKCEFRLVGSSWELPKPKRSRVQEMAEETEAVICDPRWTPKQAWMIHAIGAVCKFFRDEPGTNSLTEETARCIEREFLEPR